MTNYLDDLKQTQELTTKSSCLHSKEEVEAAIDRIAEDMNERLADKVPVFICVMNGAVIFMGQLITKLNFPLQINYIHATRYQGEIEGRELHWLAEPTISVKDRAVVIVEDILDSGLTLAAVRDFCQKQGASDIFTATLIDKKRPRDAGGVERCDFTGLEVEDKFLYGYGLDYKDYLRNVDGIYAVEG